MTSCRVAAWIFLIAAGEALMARWFVIFWCAFFFGVVCDVFSRRDSIRACVVEFLRWSNAQPTTVKILIIVLLALPVGFLVEFSRGFARWWDSCCEEAFD